MIMGEFFRRLVDKDGNLRSLDEVGGEPSCFMINGERVLRVGEQVELIGEVDLKVAVRVGGVDGLRLSYRDVDGGSGSFLWKPKQPVLVEDLEGGDGMGGLVQTIRVPLTGVGRGERVFTWGDSGRLIVLDVERNVLSWHIHDATGEIIINN